MKTATNAQSIPRNKWPAYFQLLATQYQGWATTIELISRQVGDQNAGDGLPLQGITYEKAGSQAGDIIVEVGDAGTPFETHLIHRPRVVRAAVTQPGAEADIEIDAEDGTTTLVRMRPRAGLPPSDGK